MNLFFLSPYLLITVSPIHRVLVLACLRVFIPECVIAGASPKACDLIKDPVF
jgi:hypothetical protein